jgi:hypothetical protein
MHVLMKGPQLFPSGLVKLGEGFFIFPFVPNVFPLSSHHVPKFLMCSATHSEYHLTLMPYALASVVLLLPI